MMKKKLIIGLSGLAGSGKDFVANLLVTNHGFVKIALADPLKRICQDVFDFSDEQLWGPSEERNKPDKRYFTGKFKLPAKDDIIEFEDTRIFASLSTDLEQNISEDDLYKVYLTPRLALQSLGTEWGRNCYPKVWTDYTLRIANKLLYSLSKYDPRYGLEDLHGNLPYKYVSTNGVVISDVRFRNEIEAVRAEGGKVVRIKRNKSTTLSGEASLHASEQEQQEISDAEFDYVLNNQEDLTQLQAELHSMLEQLTA